MSPTQFSYPVILLICLQADSNIIEESTPLSSLVTDRRMRPVATTTAEPRGRTCRKLRAANMAMRALRRARDLYVRGLRGLDRLIAAANPRARVGRPTSRVFGVGGERGSDQELRELVHAMQARHGGGAVWAGAVRSEKVEAGAPAVRRGAKLLERINEDKAVVHQTN